MAERYLNTIRTGFYIHIDGPDGRKAGFTWVIGSDHLEQSYELTKNVNERCIEGCLGKTAIRPDTLEPMLVDVMIECENADCPYFSE